jgi:hypothetical protein
MNCVCIESSVGLDRLATQDEVRSAMDPDSNGPAPNLREESEWLMIVGKTRDCVGN